MQKSKLNEYAFEVKLAAVARVTPPNRQEALNMLRRTVQAISLDFEEGPVRLTDASVDDCSPLLLEVNGKEVEGI